MNTDENKDRFGVAVVAFVALAASGALAPVGMASPKAPDTAEPAAKPAVLVEYRVVKVAADSLAALGLTRPVAERLGITPLKRFGAEFDPDIAALEASGKARVVHRPMIMVQQGERAEINSAGPDPTFRVVTRASQVVGGFTLDLLLELSGAGEDPLAIQRDGIMLPASLVRCPEAGDCLVVLIHAQAQDESAAR